MKDMPIPQAAAAKPVDSFNAIDTFRFIKSDLLSFEIVNDELHLFITTIEVRNLPNLCSEVIVEWLNEQMPGDGSAAVVATRIRVVARDIIKREMLMRALLVSDISHRS